MNDDIYKPAGAVALNTEGYNFQLRVGLQGYPGTSKTWAATTFQNPIFISYDRGLISHIGRSDIIELPFYNGTYVDSIKKRDGLIQPPDRKEALTTFLNKEALKFTDKQTLVIDANTGVQSSYHVWWQLNKMSFLTTAGKIDDRKEWNLKLGYYSEIATSLKALKCNVVFIFHESPDRTDSGELNGQVRPLLKGQFQDEVVSHFTDWFRCLALAKPKDAESTQKFKNAFGVSDADMKEWMASGTKETVFVWQTQSDAVCKCKTSMVGAPKYVLADYKVFNTYKRK